MSSLKEKNEAKLKEYEEKLKEAEEKEGDSEISELLRGKAMYLCRIGDKVGSVLQQVTCRNASSGSRGSGGRSGKIRGRRGIDNWLGSRDLIER